MRFCLGTTDGLRATITGFDWASIADRTMQVSRRMPRWSRNRFLVARPMARRLNCFLSIIYEAQLLVMQQKS